MCKDSKQTMEVTHQQEVSVVIYKGSSMSLLANRSTAVYNNAIDQSNLVLNIISMLEGFYCNIDIESLSNYNWCPINNKDTQRTEVYCTFDFYAWAGSLKEIQHGKFKASRTE